MATQENIADFIGSRVTLGRVQPGLNNYFYFRRWAPRYYGPALPTPQEIANALLADAEFKGLQLGGFLNSPTGEFLEQAVEMVVPRALSPEFGLIVAAVKLASDRQRGEKWGKALLAAGGGLLAVAVFNEIGKAA